jgi:hypothetical protein
MAYSNRNILITPNIGSSTAEPIVAYQGGSASSSATLYARVLDAGTLSWEATAGQVHTIGDGMTGQFFQVNDVSGIPSITVNSSGQVQLAPYQGYVTVGGNTQSTTTGTGSLQVLGGVGISGNLNIGGSFNLSANLAVGGAASTYGLSVNTTTNVAALLTTSLTTGLALQTGSYRGVGFNSYTLDGSAYTVMGTGYNGQIQLWDSNGFKFLVSAASQSAGAIATQYNSLNVNSTQIIVPQSTAATSTSTGAITTYGGISSGGAYWAGADSYFNSVRVGQGALASTSNTVVGNSSGASLITGGTANTFLGYNAGNGVTTGGNNTFIGNIAGQLIVAGSNNTGIGQSTLAQATGASVQNNTAIGYRALGSGSLITGGNTAIGTNALLLMASGINNTAIGYGAGSTISSNNNNVLIGYNAGNALGYDNCVILGNNSGGTISAAGQIIIANGAGTQRIFIDATGNVTVSASTAASTTAGTGAIITTGGASIQAGLNLGGALYAQNTAGTNGYFLQTTGSGIQWAQAAASVSNITTAGTYYPMFTSATTGNITTDYVDSTHLVYNPNTGSLSCTGNTTGGTGGYMFSGYAGYGVGTTNAVGPSGAVLQIGPGPGSINLQRWGDGSNTMSGYRFRIDQTYSFISNNGAGDNWTLTSSNGNVSTAGSQTFTTNQAYNIYINTPGATGGTGGDIGIRNGAPAIHFRNTSGNNAYLQNNSNRLYVLGAGADSAPGAWTQVNGQWPWYFQLDSNNSYCGGTLYVVGDVYSATSDERLKIIEGPITDAVAKVMELEGFYYYDNDIAKSLGVVGNRRKLGLSAQKLNKVIPEVVIPAPFDQDENLKTESKSKSGEDYLTAQYDRVVPLLVNAIKEHEHTIQAQQTQIDELKALVIQLLNK